MVKTFDFLCPDNHATDYFDWDNLNPQEITCTCGKMAIRVWLSAPGISPDKFWAGHLIKGLGYVTSREQKDYLLEKKGQAEIEPGWKDAINSTRRDTEKKYKLEQRQELIDTLFHGKDRDKPLDQDMTNFGSHEMDKDALEEISNAH